MRLDLLRPVQVARRGALMETGNPVRPVESLHLNHLHDLHEREGGGGGGLAAGGGPAHTSGDED